MCEEPKPVRCVCGKKSRVRPNSGGGSRVICDDLTCWWGPAGPSEYRAVKVWNEGMERLKTSVVGVSFAPFPKSYFDIPDPKREAKVEREENIGIALACVGWFVLGALLSGAAVAHYLTQT